MSFRVVIPARFGSQRLPGKPLADIHGKAMIVRVADAAARSNAEEVVVATDDERIAEVVESAGHQVSLTRPDHPSGSDRVMEVASARGWGPDEIVLNVQGDEPLIPPGVLDQLGASLVADDGLASATLCERIRTMGELRDPNLVKVVRAADRRALYFSRAPIPYGRDIFGADEPGALSDQGVWWRHVGVYAYRLWALAQFVGLPVAELEQIEKLEQLRLLENGMTMIVEEACQPVPGGVDTEEDLERVRAEIDGPS